MSGFEPGGARKVMKTELLYTGKPRVKVLDGWRGIAILLVLLEHLQYAFLGRPLCAATTLGQHGVGIFFVLSGYLITSSLLNRDTTLKSFYIRRLFRILPVSWTYLAVLALVSLASGTTILSRPDAISCLFFFRNHLRITTFTTHFWSLSIEEQFYLVWPVMLLTLGTQRLLRLGPALIALIVGTRAYLVWVAHAPVYNFDMLAHADGLLLGCTLALCLTHEPLRKQALRYWIWLFVPSLLCACACILLFPYRPPMLESLSVAILIGLTTLAQDHPFAVLISATWLRTIGIVSYSLYVWQQPLLLPHGNLRDSAMLVSLIPFVTVISYAWIERPCLRAGARLANRFSGVA